MTRNNNQPSDLPGGTFLTKPAPVALWGKYVDPLNMGHIPIVFQGSVVVAKPLFNGMKFQVPSKEFIEAYFEDIGIYVQVAKDNPSRIWWTGFTFFENKCFEELLSDYPYARSLYYDEQWKVIANAKDGSNYLRITHNDGSEIRIDPSSKSVSIINQEAGSTVRITDEKYEVIDGSGNYSVSTTKASIDATEEFALNTAKAIVSATTSLDITTGKYDLTVSQIATIIATTLNITANVNITGNLGITGGLIASGASSLGAGADNFATKSEEVISKLENLIAKVQTIVSSLLSFSSTQAGASATPPLTPLMPGYTALGSSLTSLPSLLTILKENLSTIKSETVKIA